MTDRPDRPLWANRMVNILTGITFGAFTLIVMLVLLKIVFTVADWAVS